MRTSLYSILCIVIRLGAVLLAWTMCSNVAALFELPKMEGFTVENRLVSSVFAVIGFAIAFVIWLFPGPLARLAAGRSSQQVFESPISASEIQWIALSVLGVYFAFSGLIGLAYLGMQTALAADYREISGAHLIRTRAIDFAYCIFQIVSGCALALGSKGLASALHRFRYSASSGISELRSDARLPSAD